MEKTKYLIIGNGMAGLAAVREIRKNDKENSITMVTSEPSLTYYRTKLTEYLAKDFKDEDLLVSKEDWYKDNNINVILSKIVEDVDVEGNKVKLDDGKEIEYEKLLLATGSRPFVPPITGKFKEGVFALRTLKDVNYIQEYLKDCEEVTVIGGGLLGLEAAWSLKELGKKVTIVEFAPYLLPRQLDEEISKRLTEKLTEEGFTIYLDSQAEEILGEGKADGIKLKGGSEFKTDAILVSSGVRSNLDLVRETSIEFDKGIIVDEKMKTNIDNIYAAGDVAEVNGMVVALWTASNEQGRVAGGNMANKDLEYVHPKIFANLQIGSIKLFSAGDINDFDSVYEYKEEENQIHHKIFVKDNKIQGIILFGDIKDMNDSRNAVVSKMNIDDYLKDKDMFKKI